MQVIFAAAIIIAFATGFAPQAEIAKNRVDIYTGSHPALRLRHEVIPGEELAYRHVTAQEHDYSCGSAALATLLNYSLGESLSEKQVIRGMLKHGDAALIKKRQAFSLLDMKRLCSVLGYEAAGYKAEIADIKNPDYWPTIVPLKMFGYRHFVVLKGVYDNRVFLADPFRGNVSYTLEQFRDAWYENVMFIVSEATQQGADKNLLRLTTDDLCYVSEDITWDMIKNRPETFELPDRLEQKEVKGEYQIYRP
ncbi:MAG: C39 family peptidase [Desulfobacteraceae bacterium]|nr:C39 family peptidase [Desulfobacteraceae bacterium]